MNQPSKLSVVLEYIWLGVFIILLLLGVHSVVTKGIHSSLGLFVLIVLSFFMYYLRRQRRIGGKN